MKTFARILVRPPWIGSPMLLARNELAEPSDRSRRREDRFPPENIIQWSGTGKHSSRNGTLGCQSTNITSLLISKT